MTSEPLNQYTKICFFRKRVRDAAFFFIIMLVTFAATLLNLKNMLAAERYKSVWNMFLQALNHDPTACLRSFQCEQHVNSVY